MSRRPARCAPLPWPATGLVVRFDPGAGRHDGPCGSAAEVESRVGALNGAFDKTFTVASFAAYETDAA